MYAPIIFRAWDEQNRVMHYNFEFITSGTEGNDWIVFKSDKQKLEDGKVFDNPYFRQQLKIMQYTGLDDQEGNKIFVGDIIFVDEEKWVVVFELGMFGYKAPPEFRPTALYEANEECKDARRLAVELLSAANEAEKQYNLAQEMDAEDVPSQQLPKLEFINEKGMLH